MHRHAFPSTSTGLLSRSLVLSSSFPELALFRRLFRLSLFLYLHFQHRTFHTQTVFRLFFPFFLLSENFPSSHEKHFPNDWFSLRLNLHDARRVLLFGLPGHCSVSPQNAEKEFISDREMNKFSLKKSVKTDKKD